VGAGAIAYSLGRHGRRGTDAVVRTVLAPLGRLWRVPESWLDAVTALSGSGPAYVFHLAECLASAGKRLGLPKALAEALARQTLIGAGRLLEQARESAEELRRQVTSPGGTTAAALDVLERAGLDRIFKNALGAASRRSKELSADAPGADGGTAR
jgi:pyrroline-5-carboxylate reductase